jgi:flavin reductase (DIM6/NTAB) family NADH-FMN oxidoreductase RutF
MDLDPKALRNAFGAFATGVTIITTHADGIDTGLTANSFSSVSLDPPMILWSLDRKSRSLDIFENAEGFAVHVLASDQEALSNRFARSAPDKFETLKVGRGDWAMPLLPDCAARFECRKAFTYEGGDHVIFVGEVLRYEHTERPPLLFHGGRYKQARATWEPLDNDPPLATTLSMANRICREEAMALAAQAGICWPDVISLGVILRLGATSQEAIAGELAASCLLFDECSARRLQDAGLIDHAQAEVVATAKGRKLASDIVAAIRAKELELRVSYDGRFDSLEAELAAFLAPFEKDPNLAPVRELHRSGRSLQSE